MLRWLPAALLLVACNEPFRFGLAAAVRLDRDSVTIRWGTALQLHATVTDSSGRILRGYPVLWSSSNAAAVGVSARGLVTARDGGAATITAEAGPVRGAVAVTVHVPVASVTFGYPNRTVLLGASIALVATPRDSLGRPLAGRAIAWASDDTTIVAISPAGVASGRALGAATITATSEGRVGGATVRVDAVRFAAVAAAESDHSCALTDSGRAFCWGNGILGELGNGTSTGSLTPVEVAGGLTFTALTGGGWFTCGVPASGAAVCWGSGARGRLGSGVLQNSTVPLLVAGGLSFTAVSAGWAHGCGLTDDDAYCWGSGTALGSDAGKYSLIPLPVTGNVGFLALDAGGDFSCALTGAGEAWCWGVNYYGQLGDGSTAPAMEPTVVSGGHVFSGVSVGSAHACGLTQGGDAWCWGDNSTGQLGDGTRESATSPAPVAGSFKFAGLTAGGGFTCGWTVDGPAYCWGVNTLGQLGATSADVCDTRSCSLTPLSVAGGLRFRDVRAGGAHACGIAEDGLVYCWGGNQSGQLGNGTTESRSTPAAVIGQR